jgi:hypothetical protein
MMRVGSSPEAIKRFEIEPVLGSALPEVARFLQSWDTRRDQGSAIERPLREDSPSPEARLRWLQWLLVANPLATAASQHGLCIRDASGVIAGLLLSFPGAFLAGDRRIRGLGSGSFFVDPRAQTLGFYLFKRYLTAPGYGFFFSTTCNANSGALWKALGARAVPDSDTEYILPLKLDVMLPAFLARRNPSPFGLETARVFGRCANRVLQLFARGSGQLVIEPCRDWEKLAELSRRHRPANWITTDRSAAFLQGRYGQNPPNHPFDVWLFRDKRGNEGWFSLGTIVRGVQGQIRGGVLLDVIWPRERMSFSDILPAVVRLVASEADAIVLPPRPGLDYGECSRWIIPRTLDAPRVFALTRKGAAPLTVSSLDLVATDGEGPF